MEQAGGGAELHDERGQGIAELVVAIGDDIGQAVTVHVAEVGAGVGAGDRRCTRKGAVPMAHERVGGGETAVVPAVDTIVGKAGVDVGIAVTVEIRDCHITGVVNGLIGATSGEATVAFADPGGNAIAAAEHQVELAIVVQIAAGQVRSLVGYACWVRECRRGGGGEGAVPIAQQDQAVGGDKVFLVVAPQVCRDQVEDGCGG
jgi:hypothetical protein